MSPHMSAAVSWRQTFVVASQLPVEQSLSAAQPSPSTHGVEQVVPPQSIVINVPSLTPLTQEVYLRSAGGATCLFDLLPEPHSPSRAQSRPWAYGLHCWLNSRRTTTPR